MKRPSLPTFCRPIQNLSCTTCTSLRWAGLGAVLLACQIPGKAQAQTVYTYAGTNSTARNWSASATWTTLSGPGTTYPGSDGSATADTADIENPAATTNLTYDTGATGYVGTLNMFQSTTNATTTLTLSQNLTLNQGGSLYSSLNANNLEVINLGSSTLTIGSGANFTLGLAAATTLGGGTPITTTGTGGLMVSGTLTVASAVTLSETIAAPVTLSGGTITINDNGAAVKNVLTVTGNFTSTGASAFQATGANATGATILFEGASTTLSAGTTTTGFGTTSGTPAFTFLDAGSTNTAQTVGLGALLPNAAIRSSNATGTASSQLITTKIFSSSATSGSVANAIDSVYILNQKGYTSLVFTLGSNLNLAASQASAFTFSLAGGAGTQGNIDLAGFEYNAAASTSTIGFTPSASTTAGSTQINILNSGTSSINGGNGIFQASNFILSTSDIGIGTGVILQASGAAGTVNNLGVVASGVTTINSGSTFYYTGAGTAASPATLTSALNSTATPRTIGALTVGNGTTASNLQLATATLPVAGNVTINSGSTLQLGGQVLSMTSTASLTGTGTVAGTTAGVASTGNAVTFTGTGGIVPGTSGVVGMLTLTGTQTVTLASGSLSLFDIASAASFDQVLIGSGNNVTVNYGGTLALNFLNSYAPTSGSFQIASAEAAGTNFSSITSNLNNGDTFSFSPTTGLLSITTVPEPGSLVQAGMVLVFVFGAGAFKQVRPWKKSAR